VRGGKFHSLLQSGSLQSIQETFKGRNYFLGGGKQDNRGTQEQDNTQEEARREKQTEGENQNVDTKIRTGPCKPKATITPRVVLSDPMLQVHREHMVTYALL